ncbi:MAG TPA: isochorismatase family protein [Anaerolineae bacterium]|nr:isochorismatase family protein [Anaerolineae bacterium]HPL28133.1 isochorismatase family protein [Anaerolineae bacterium]
MARIWDDVVTERDRLVYEAAGYGQRVGFGRTPAMLIIDVTYNFTGDKPEPILQSVAKFSRSCGLEAWEAVSKIRQLLEVARPKRIPVFYSIGRREKEALPRGRMGKNRRAVPEAGSLGNLDQKIVDEIAPQGNDVVLTKTRPSFFFETPLLGHLHALGVDSLLICGCTTSGCVRATAVDATDYGFLTTVVEDCCFDRGQVSHKVSLFDLHQKHADVLPLAEVLEWLEGLSIP